MAGLFALLLGGSLAPVQAQTVISGTFLGSDGKALPVAHVAVFPFFGRRQVPRLITAENGRYRLAVDEPGLLRLQFQGPLHRTHEVVVLVEDQPSIALDVQVQRAWLDPDQSFTRVAASHTDFAYEEGVSLEEQADGSYTAILDVPGDTLIYTLPAALSRTYTGLVIEHLTADRFVYSGTEGYLAVVAGSAGRVQVTLRPQRLDAAVPPAPVVVFGPADGRAAALWDVYQRMREAGQFRFSQAMRAGTPIPSATADADRANVVRQEMLALEVEMERAVDPFRKRLLLLFYLQRSAGLPYHAWGGGFYRAGYRLSPASSAIVQRDLVARIIEEIPPTSVLWTLHPTLLQVLIEESGVSEVAVAYVERAIEGHPDTTVRQYALYNLIDGLYARQGLSPDVVGYLERYDERDRGDVPSFAFPLRRDPAALVGRRAPEFGDVRWERRDALSSDSLKGQVVLLDFSTSWCKACVADRDLLQSMHATYGDRGLKIIRVALDYGEPPAADTDDLPWLTYRGEDGFKSRIATRFDVSTLPHRVLIDREGVILAVGAALFGDRLIETVDGVFND